MLKKYLMKITMLLEKIIEKIMINLDMRDTFFKEVYSIAKKDKNLFVVSVDYGAPMLDRIRNDLPNQFINAGISEQNAVSLSAGMANE